VGTQSGGYIGEPLFEAVELRSGHRRKERTREGLVIPLELGDERLPRGGERHECCSPIARVWFARHEPARDERVHEPRDRPRCDLQCGGEDSLGYRPTLAQFPEQMGSGAGKAQRPKPLCHVVVQRDDQRQHAVENVFTLVYFQHSEG